MNASSGVQLNAGAPVGTMLKSFGAPLLLLATLLYFAVHQIPSSSQQTGITDLVVLVERKDDSIELYFRLAADRLDDVFRFPENQMTGTNGTVEFSNLENGTFDLGDKMFSEVITTIDGEIAKFEAMSMMVHLNEIAPNFTDAVDGMLAISVCNTAAPLSPLTLAQLTSFSGFIAYTSKADQPLRFKFPVKSDAKLNVRIREFKNRI